MVVSLQIGRSLTDTEIAKHARGLIAAADALTAQLGGVKPQSSLQLADDDQRLGRLDLQAAPVLEVTSGALMARMSLASSGWSLK